MRWPGASASSFTRSAARRSTTHRPGRVASRRPLRSVRAAGPRASAHKFEHTATTTIFPSSTNSLLHLARRRGPRIRDRRRGPAARQRGQLDDASRPPAEEPGLAAPSSGAHTLIRYDERGGRALGPPFRRHTSPAAAVGAGVADGQRGPRRGAGGGGPHQQGDRPAPVRDRQSRPVAPAQHLPQARRRLAGDLPAALGLDPRTKHWDGSASDTGATAAQDRRHEPPPSTPLPGTGSADRRRTDHYARMEYFSSTWRVCAGS